MRWTLWPACSSRRARSTFWRRASSSWRRISAAAAASSSWKAGTTWRPSPVQSLTPSARFWMNPALRRSLTIRRCCSKSRHERSERRQRRPRAFTHSRLAPKFKPSAVRCGVADYVTLEVWCS
uniref:GSVIVT01026467001 n=1 Tax=Arundo donax TaxID=35708 RepID=A0A0A8YKL7_ARUDO